MVLSIAIASLDDQGIISVGPLDIGRVRHFGIDARFDPRRPNPTSDASGAWRRVRDKVSASVGSVWQSMLSVSRPTGD